MSPTTRPFARRILLLHAALLAGVIALVLLASYEVYQRTREQLVTQAARRQELLAKQTASAIDAYYTSIAADLTFIRRSESATTAPTEPRHSERSEESRPFDNERRPLTRDANVPPAPRAIPPRLLRPLWNQLEGRASHLLYVHRQTLAVAAAYPESANRDEAQHLLRPFTDFLRDLDKPAVSPFRQTRDGGATLVAAPLGGGDYVLCAVVPASTVEQQFFRVVNRDSFTRATLLDQNGVVMVTSDPTNPLMVPTEDPVPVTSTRPARRMLRRLDMSQLTPGTHEYWTATPFPSTPNPRDRAGTPITLPPRLTTVEPAAVDNHTLYVVVTSSLADITAPATTMFTRAFVGAIFVILAVTAILLSTAIRLIRDRQRIESLRHEMLKRELDQARAIQLHWLPTEASVPAALEIAATNQTANHISGDFYDWFVLPDGRCAVSIGDVTGHGMSAAFLMSTTQLLVRTSLPRTLDPAACLTEVNRLLCSQQFHGQFVTILLLTYDPRTGALSMATAGHMPPLLRTAAGFAPVPLEPDFPLGLEPDTVYRADTTTLPDGATLLLYTDGLTDATDHAAEHFSLARVTATLNALPADAPAAGLISSLLSAVNAFRGARPLSDDLTIVAIRPRRQRGQVIAP